MFLFGCQENYSRVIFFLVCLLNNSLVILNLVTLWLKLLPKVERVCENFKFNEIMMFKVLYFFAMVMSTELF